MRTQKALRKVSNIDINSLALYVKQVTERNDLILNVVPQTRLQLNEKYQD